MFICACACMHSHMCVCVCICVCARTRVRTCKRDYVFMEGDGEIERQKAGMKGSG